MITNLHQQKAISYYHMDTVSVKYARQCFEMDADCDSDTGGSDASLFKQDFGRSSLQNPCPIFAAAGRGVVINNLKGSGS